MNAASSEAWIGDSSCIRISLSKATSPTVVIGSLVTLIASSPSATTWPPLAVSRAASCAVCGVLTRMDSSELASMNSCTEQSATRRPRPITIEVVGGGLHLAHQVRGDEHRAALGGQRLHQVADPQDALGVQPVDRLVEHQHLRVAQQRRGDAQPLAHAQREAAWTACAPLRSGPTSVEHLVHPAPGDPVASAPGTAGGCTPLRPPCTALASSSAPTSRSGYGRCSYGRPSTVTGPAVGRSRPRIIRIVVDLPAPFGPRKPVTWPGFDRERQVVHRQPVPVPLREAARLDHRAPTLVTPHRRLRGAQLPAAAPLTRARVSRPGDAGHQTGV